MRLMIAMVCAVIGLSGAVALADTNETVAASLEIQFQTTLIRERRLADDRDLRMLREAELRVQRARAQADARASGAEAELLSARAALAAATTTLVARDAEALELSEAYSIQVARDLLQATPGQLAALQRFADGDLQAGMDQYLAESRRRSAARRQIANQAVTAADSGDLAEARQLATMSDTMVAVGRGTVLQALTFWDEVARLSPGDSYANQRRARLAMSLNDTTRAHSAAEAALATAQTDLQRASALLLLADIAESRNDLRGASGHADAALALARIMPEHTSDSFRMSYFLSQAGSPRLALGDVTGARRLFEEARDAAIASGRNQANQANADYDLVRATFSLAQIKASTGDLTGAVRSIEEVSASLERLLGPRRTAGDYSLVVSVTTWGGSIALRANNFEVARQMYQDAADMAHAAMEVDPTNAGFARSYSAALTGLGDAHRQLGSAADARSAYRESLAIDQRLFEADRNNVTRITDYWISLWRVARYGGGRWSEVVRVMEDAERRGLLPREHQSTLAQARTLAREERR